MRPVLRDNRRVLIAVVAVAFLLRLSAGLAKGPDFVVSGYTFYAELARTFWAGQGLCYQPGLECAQRMPLYPIVVAPFLAAEAAYPWLIVLHAALGALQPVFAYALAVRLFTVPVALVAAVGTALNPYAVIHGPSFQDTVVFNFLMSLAVLLLIWSADHRDRLTSVLAGLALALAMLTTIRLALFIPFAIAWVILAQHQAPWRERVLRGGPVAAPVVLLLGGWMARNARVVGAPVLTTEAGLSLWLANSAATSRCCRTGASISWKSGPGRGSVAWTGPRPAPSPTVPWRWTVFTGAWRWTIGRAVRPVRWRRPPPRSSSASLDG